MAKRINFKVALRMFLLMCLFGVFAVSGGGHLSAQSKPNAPPREALLAAMRAKLNARSYRLKEVQFGSGEGVGLSFSTTGSYVAPDKYQATVEMGGSGKGEMILIGGVAYAKSPGGTWEKKQADPQRIEREFARLRHPMLIDKLTKARNADVKLAGQEALEGLTTYVYQYSFYGPPEIGIRFQTRVWVGVSDGLPHKIELESRTTQKGLKFRFRTTTSYFDYNADIVIDAPM